MGEAFVAEEAALWEEGQGTGSKIFFVEEAPSGRMRNRWASGC